MGQLVLVKDQQLGEKIKGAVKQDGLCNAFGWVGDKTEGLDFVNGRKLLLVALKTVSGVKVKSYFVVYCDSNIF